MTSIHQQFVDAGCTIDSHESDLYVKAEPKAWEIIKTNMPVSHKAFRDQQTGEHWIELPFQYDPFWEKKLTRP